MEVNLGKENLAIIQTIDYLLKKLRFKYDKEKKIVFDDEDIELAKKSGNFIPPDESIYALRGEKMIEFHWKEHKIYDGSDEYIYSTYDRIISYIDTLRLFEYKRKLL